MQIKKINKKKESGRAERLKGREGERVDKGKPPKNHKVISSYPNLDQLWYRRVAMRATRKSIVH